VYLREAAENRQAAERLAAELDQSRTAAEAVRAELAALRGSRLVRWRVLVGRMLVPAELARMAKRQALRVLGKVRSRTSRS
jgi:hypothetical protein